MEECLFCKIVAGDIPCSKVYEDDMVLAFRDINPAAPEHILVIPKEHYANFAECDDRYIVAIKNAVTAIVKETGIDRNGYRLVFNTGVYGCQSVNHVHCHILGGRQMEWPPG